MRQHRGSINILIPLSPLSSRYEDLCFLTFLVGKPKFFLLKSSQISTEFKKPLRRRRFISFYELYAEKTAWSILLRFSLCFALLVLHQQWVWLHTKQNKTISNTRRKSTNLPTLQEAHPLAKAHRTNNLLSALNAIYPAIQTGLRKHVAENYQHQGKLPGGGDSGTGVQIFLGRDEMLSVATCSGEGWRPVFSLVPWPARPELVRCGSGESGAVWPDSGSATAGRVLQVHG